MISRGEFDGTPRRPGHGLVSGCLADFYHAAGRRENARIPARSGQGGGGPGAASGYNWSHRGAGRSGWRWGGACRLQRQRLCLRQPAAL